MIDKIIILFSSFDFWSATCGFFGSIFIFYFGLPPKISQDGEIYLICEQNDIKEKNKAKKYKILSYIGLSLITLSFAIQIVKLF